MAKKKLIIPFLLLSSFVMSGCNSANGNTNLNDNNNNDSGNVNIEEDNINDNTEIDVFYNITFVTNGGTLPKGYRTVVKVKALTSYKLPEPTKTGNSFDGWFLNENFTGEHLSECLVVSSDLTLYAKWSEIQYKITYELNGGENNPSNPAGFSISSLDIELEEPTKEGSVFIGWTSDDENIPNKNYKIKHGTCADKVVTANWFETARISNNGNLEEPDETQVGYNGFYVLNLKENNIFLRIYYRIFDNGFVKCDVECGEYKEEDNGVIRLIYGDSRADEFVIQQSNTYVYTDINGTPLNELGNDGVELVVDNAVEPFIEGKDRYGYRSLNFFKNAKDVQQIYNKIWEKCEEILESNEDLTSNTLLTINLKESGISMDDYLKLFKLFLLDNPQYYFLSRTISVSEHYAQLIVDSDYLKGDVRLQINSDIDLLVQNCAKTFTIGENNLSRYLAIHNYVDSIMDYAYATDGTPSDEVWAHNIVGATIGSGVCQSYADTFDFLCTTFGLEDIQVTGTVNCSGESHVWNLINVEGSYYSVDTTWDDLREDDYTHSFFGLSYADTGGCKTIQTTQGEGIDYLYQIPKMSTSTLQLVYLNKDNKQLGLFKNIDDALNSITDSESEYSIEMFDYGVASGPLLLSGPNVKFTSSNREWPNAKKISIIGEIYNLDNGYYTKKNLTFNQDTTFNSDVEFSNLTIGSRDVSLCFDGYALTTTGKDVTFNTSINSSNGSIYCKATYETTFYSDITVDEINIYRRVLFRASAYINKINMRKFGGSIDLNAYDAPEYLFMVNEINISEEYDSYLVSMFITTKAYDHYANSKNRLEKYSITIGDFVNSSKENIIFSIDQRFDYDNEYADININGVIKGNLRIEANYTGELKTYVTDASGNDVAEYTRYGIISSGQKLMYAPNIDPSKITFRGSEITSVTKTESGYFIKD